ncbi:MAG: T9SS type A sorting domain-containing protein [Flavitalea sp.]
MKTIQCLVVCALVCMLPVVNLKAQCAPGTGQSSITYDTTVVGVGRAPYHFVFPRFDPSVGTLVAVRLQSVATITYQFTLENLEYTPKNVRHRLTRFDELSGATLSSGVYNEYTTPWFGYYPVAANDNNPFAGPDAVHVGPVNIRNNDTMINNTYYNTAAYMGTGTVSFDYTTDAENTLSGGTLYDGSITDVLRFNITYVYCSANVLASGTIDLTAQNAGPMSALLRWNSKNESRASAYEVMMSADGTNFKTVATVPASGVYSNDIGHYTLKYDLSAPSQKLHFRIKQLTKDNKVAYTAVRPVLWGVKGNEFQVVADAGGSYINVQVPQGGGNWAVDLYNVNGQLLQKNNLSGTGSEMIPLKKKLQKGIYVVRVTNTATKELHVKKIFIQ